MGEKICAVDVLIIGGGIHSAGWHKHWLAVVTQQYWFNQIKSAMARLVALASLFMVAYVTLKPVNYLYWENHCESVQH